jgi:3-oxoacyl-[acyl-carrier protein] reductase
VAGGAAHAVQADVTSRPAVDALLANSLAAYGQVDLLVNNAGVFGNARFEEMTDEQWQRMLHVNLYSVFLVSQVLVRHWLAAGSGGAIVNLASVSGTVAFTDSSHYAAAKTGVIGLTRSLAMELGPQGMRVNAVAPGIIATEMTRRSLETPELSGDWLRRIPQRRYGTPEDVAGVVAFLLSPDAAYINGEVVFIDGGGTFAWSKPSDATR